MYLQARCYTFFVDQITSAIYLWEIPRLINNLLMKSEQKFFLCSSIWKFHFLQTAKCPWAGNLSFMTLNFPNIIIPNVIKISWKSMR